MNYTPLNSRKAFTNAAYSPKLLPVVLHLQQFPYGEAFKSSQGMTACDP